MIRHARSIAALLLIGLVSTSACASQALPVDKIRLPPGFSISVYAANVPNARAMSLGPNGTLFVGSMQAGNVYAVVDRDKDYRADEVITIARGLQMPTGVAVHNGALYVAAISRVLRFDNIESQFRNSPKPVVVTANLPTETHHGWKFIAFGPDGMLYVPVGAPCNICDPGARHGNISRMKPDGSGLEVFARGIRNSVGFDWDPQTRDLWFTDNGRDNLGDNVPPDELNRVAGPGMHFGYPDCHAGTIKDPELGREPCSKFAPPAMPLGPHVAALGMRFYTGSMFPPSYRNQIFIAEHGSWNRSSPIGYRISLVHVENGKAVKYETFADGWLQGSSAWGRPADVLVMPDGSLLVADDKAGAIYRITYRR